MIGTRMFRRIVYHRRAHERREDFRAVGSGEGHVTLTGVVDEASIP
jgi:hypothetical protein